MKLFDKNGIDMCEGPLFGKIILFSVPLMLTNILQLLYNAADIVVIGSPLYWHNICGSVRNVLDRFYDKVEDGELSGRKLYFVFQGAAPEKWMLDAGEYTMKRFAGLYGMTYGGMATNENEATKLGKNI